MVDWSVGVEMSKANGYLRQLMERFYENAPPDSAELVAARARFNALLAEDERTAAAQERQKLKALVVAADHFFDAIQGNRSDTRLSLFNDLVNLATGVRGENDLSRPMPRRKQRTAEEDWQIARGIVAVKKGFGDSQNFKKWLMRNTGKTPAQIKKFMDNMGQERGPYDGVKTNVADIEQRYDAGESWMFDDLIR